MSVVALVEDVVLGAVVGRADAGKTHEQVRQVVDRKRPVTRFSHLEYHVGVAATELVGEEDDHRHLKFVVRHLGRDGCVVRTSEAHLSAVVDVLAVIRKVDENGVLALELFVDGRDDRVVVIAGVVVVDERLQIALAEVLALVIGRVERLLLLFERRTVFVGHVLAVEVHDDEFAVSMLERLEFLADEDAVRLEMQRAAMVETHGVHVRAVEEEGTVDVAVRLLLVGVELIAEEVHLITRQLKEGREEHTVRPVAFLVGAVGRHDVLEDVARQVPRAYHVVEGYESALLHPSPLFRGGGHGVTVELRVVLGVALADDEHNLRATERAAVHDGLLGVAGHVVGLANHETVELLRPNQTQRGAVEVALAATLGVAAAVEHEVGHDALHALHPSRCAGDGAHDEERGERGGQPVAPQLEPSRRGDVDEADADKGSEGDVGLLRLYDDGEKFAAFACCGVAHEHKHGGRDAHVETQRQEHLNDAQNIHHHGSRAAQPRAPPLGQQQECRGIEVEPHEQLCEFTEVVLGGVVHNVAPDDVSHHHHEDEAAAVANGRKDSRTPSRGPRAQGE